MYKAQNLEELGFLKHLIITSAYKDQESFTPYLTFVDEKGNPKDWLFDSFLFVTGVKSKRALIADINVGTTMSGEGDFHAKPVQNPANKEDWKEVIEHYIHSAKTLSLKIEQLNKKIGPPPFKRNLVITQPYPGILQNNFGELNGKHLDFSSKNQTLNNASKDRLKACLWFQEEFLIQWNNACIQNLNLLGFYWPFETVYRGWEVDDHWVLKEQKKSLNAKGLKVFWIPFFATYNTHLLDNYEDYYFDCAFYQPNYLFYKNIKGVGDCALEAKKRNAGFEMEYYMSLDEPTQTGKERHSRFRDYLNGGIEYGYIHAACAWFIGGGIHGMLKDQTERGFYQDIYHFVKGDYTKK
ncbi:MAG TPA: DUF4855 domain-containing protein [Thermotogota bacterium]|nr:DUF4855 domain-containing protein [Thermotogota bacterium]